MCGIFGIYGSLAQSPTYCDNLAHRGPDSQGELHLPGLYLKHFRLAIIGEKEFAAQPMISRDGNIALTFNGEIYNYKELAATMGQPSLAEEGDTRVLIEMLAKYGQECLPKLNGMFAFAAYNKKSKKLLVVRDRLGIKPLYYMSTDNSFLFSSEIKGFESAVRLKMDRSKIEGYLDCSIYPSGNDTFYEQVKQLTPGCSLEISTEGIKQKQFYDIKEDLLDWIEKKPDTKLYEELLENSIRLRMRSDVPVSLHFSGGTDSTALLLKMKEMYGKVPVVSFSMAFEGEEDESALAESYCRTLGAEIRKVPFDPEETPELAEQLCALQDEPFGGIPAIAYYKLNKAEREQGFIVSLEGQGGDETLAGYLTHETMGLIDMHEHSLSAKTVEKLAEYMGKPIDQIINEGSAFFDGGFQGHVDMTDLRINNAGPVKTFVDRLRTIQLHDITGQKIPRVLRFNDRSSMGAGREVRFPLLDHRVVACGVALSHEDKFANGLGKSPLRKIIARHMPHVANEPKRFVVTPQTRWLQGCLKKWALERVQILQDSSKIPEKYFKCVDTFYSDSNPSSSFALWQLINLSYFVDRL